MGLALTVAGMLSNGMLLITVTGRKTGRKYTTPVEYFHEDDNLWVMTNRDRTWWRNLKSKAEVSSLLKRKSVAAIADLVVDKKSMESQCQNISNTWRKPRNLLKFVSKIET